MPLTERKAEYFEKLHKLIEEHDKILIVEADNVGSNQLQKIRVSLRGIATVLMGKNTMIRKAIRQKTGDNPALEKILNLVRGNVGFVFIKGDIAKVREAIDKHKVAAPARVGALAPCDVIVPAGNTGLEPTQTAFLQALNITTKINKGTIEIINDVHLLKPGMKVGSSESTLLQKLNIKPFSYGLKLKFVYDAGSVYAPHVLDLTDEDLLAHFRHATQNVAQLSLAINYPTPASLPHSLIRGFKNLLAVSVSSDYTFKQSETIKEFLKDPSKFASAAPAAASAPAAAGKPAAKAAEPEPEKEEEGGEGFGGLFD